MIGVLLLLLAAKMQDHYQDRPAWQWAFGFAAVSSVFAWIGLPAYLVNVLVLGLYVWGYFALLRRVGDNLLLWLAVYLLGALLPLLLPFVLLSHT